MVIKVLHLFCHLSQNYSFSMQFLKKNSNVLPSLESDQKSIEKLGELTTLEVITSLLPLVPQLQSEEIIKFLIDLLENLTVSHFYKSINALVGQSSETLNINQSIAIKETTASGLIQLLEDNMLKEHLPAISRIIMRLCLNNDNMAIFIEKMRNMVRKLA